MTEMTDVRKLAEAMANKLDWLWAPSSIQEVARAYLALTTPEPEPSDLERARELIVEIIGPGDWAVETTLTKRAFAAVRADERSKQGWRPISEAPQDFQDTAALYAKDLRLGELCLKIVYWGHDGSTLAVVRFNNPAPSHPVEYFVLPPHH